MKQNLKQEKQLGGQGNTCFTNDDTTLGASVPWRINDHWRQTGFDNPLRVN